jgi:hypothetical protein
MIVFNITKSSGNKSKKKKISGTRSNKIFFTAKEIKNKMERQLME